MFGGSACSGQQTPGGGLPRPSLGDALGLRSFRVCLGGDEAVGPDQANVFPLWKMASPSRNCQAEGGHNGPGLSGERVRGREGQTRRETGSLEAENEP